MIQEQKTTNQGETLEHEIRIVREMIAQVHEQAVGLDDVSELRRILVSVSQASSRLARLLKAQNELEREANGNNTLQMEMDRELAQLAAEKGLRVEKGLRAEKGLQAKKGLQAEKDLRAAEDRRAAKSPGG